MVGCDSFMVNCCARAGTAAKSTLTAMPATAKRLVVTCMFFLPFWSFSAFGEQGAHADQRDFRDVSDERQRDQIDYHERQNAAVDGLELEPEHGLRHENVDAEGRMKQADGQVDRDHDAEMNAVDAYGLYDRHQQWAQQQDRRQRIEEAAHRQEEDVDREQEPPVPDIQGWQ